MATPLNTLVVLDDGPIDEIADLKGGKIGFSVGGFEHALLGAMLARHGLTPDDVELVNVNFALSPALLSGQVDAVIGAYRNFELNQLDLEGSPGRAFYPEEEGVPAYDELIFIANSDKLDDPRLPRFLDAIEAGTLYLLNHPDESFAAVHRGPPGAGRRAEPARLAGHPAALRAPPGGDGHRPLRALRRLPRAAGPDQVAAAGRGLRGRAGALGPSHGAESPPTRSALSLAHHAFAWAGIGASIGEACCGRGRVWTATRRGRGRRLMPVPPERWMRLTHRL